MLLLQKALHAPRKQLLLASGMQLDLAYIQPDLIVCSMPTTVLSGGWRYTSLAELLVFLRAAHGDQWHVFNLRAEAHGDYADAAFDGRVTRFPWPDHHAPPFALMLRATEALNEFLHRDNEKSAIGNPNDEIELGSEKFYPAKEGAIKEMTSSNAWSSSPRVAVVHCKAGQGRSGTVVCAFLMRYRAMTFDEAVQTFTIRRMRGWYGSGVSIQSQRRYLHYLEGWAALGQRYDPEYQAWISTLRFTRVRAPLKITLGEYRGSNIATIGQFYASAVKGKGVVDLDLQEQNLTTGPDVFIKVEKVGTMLQPAMASIWFNVYFETELEPFSRHQSTFSASWSQFDGFSGTSVRGAQLFDELCVQWASKHSQN